jgi:uncharacterized delta-60 repeat protein
MRPVRLGIALSLVLSLFIPAPAAHAEPGDLDATFGGTGLVVADLDPRVGNLGGVAVREDGKIIVAGSAGPNGSPFPPAADELRVMRYNPDGSLDTTFSGDGVDSVPISGSPFFTIVHVGLQSDEKIVVAYGGIGPWSVVRFLAGGGVDSSFGSGGTISVSPGTGSREFRHMALQPDDRILLTGMATAVNPRDRVAIVRLTADGTVDSGFGIGGAVLEPTPGTSPSADAVAVAPDGDVLLAGSAHPPGQNWSQFLLMRFTSAGTRESAFGSDGYAHADFEIGGIARAIGVDPLGRILLAGFAPDPDDTSGNEVADFAAARFLDAGGLDPAFGTEGLTRVHVGDTLNVPGDLSVQPDGSVLLGGYREGASTVEDAWAVVSLTEDGVADSSFGTGGVAITQIAGGGRILGMDLNPELRLMAVGKAGGDLAVARYETGATAPPVPDTEPPTSTITRPKDGATYSRSRIREFRGTAGDGDSGVAQVDIALLSRGVDGSCSWWNGTAFVAGTCATKVWLLATGTDTWSYVLPRRLAASTGSSPIQSYGLYARATDPAGNLEIVRTFGQNANKFDAS